MKAKKILLLNNLLLLSVISVILNSCYGGKKENYANRDTSGNLFIGWASVDITPDKSVLLLGQFPARVSEGVMDPITATALAIESVKGDGSSEKTIMISCDLAVIGDLFQPEKNFRDNVREILKRSVPELSPYQIIINATHTHTAPVISTLSAKDIYGVELDVMPPSDYLKFLSDRLAAVAEQAWKNRKHGGISYGLGYAVVGHNRLQSDLSGKSLMYGNTNRPEFSHIEGYEDHSVNLLYTWDNEKKLTGVVINVSCPSQVSEHEYLISADYWHDTRMEVRKRLGNDLYILPQCGAGGDQSPHIMVGAKAEDRMQRIMFYDSIKTGRGTIGRRKQIAMSIADAVTSVFPYMKDNIEWSPSFDHKMEVTNLSRRLISLEDVISAQNESEEWKKKYKDLIQKINENPEVKKKPRWYNDVTRSYSMTMRGQSVKERYDLQKVQPEMPVEIHVVRISDMVMVTNSFELYLDYGIRIKAQSPAVQTFIVNLTGSYDGYLPTIRSVKGGAYGAVPASTLMGPEGGQELIENSLRLINAVWIKR
jgi:hypothetical protein